MSKAVMISIRPKWCEKIVSGEKTIEVRKTRPKLETPFKCYIYRTKGTVPHIINDKWVQMEVGGTIIGEFICDRIYELETRSPGSCDMGRRQFARGHGIDVEHAAMTLQEFLALTKDAYGGDVIRRVLKELEGA